MKKKIDRHLHEGEKILCVERPSWIRYWHHIMFSPLVFPLVIAGLKKYSTHFIVTDKRVLTRHGVVGEHSKSVSFANLTTVKVHQPVRGKLFNYGHLHLHTHTGGHADLNFHYIKNPIIVKKEIEKGIAKYENKIEKNKRS